jgi:teichuronic acid biosynthesis glycosyltransferase TuaC
VCDAALGMLVPFGDEAALEQALDAALGRRWDAAAIRRHAEDNTWERRVRMLVQVFRGLHAERGAALNDTQEASRA